MPTLAILSSHLKIEFSAAESPVQVLVDQMLMSGDIELCDLDRAKIDRKATVLAPQTINTIVSWGQLKRSLGQPRRNVLPRLHYLSKPSTTWNLSPSTEPMTSILSTETKISTGESSPRGSGSSSMANSESTTYVI